jgi:hypothetical protein
LGECFWGCPFAWSFAYSCVFVSISPLSLTSQNSIPDDANAARAAPESFLSLETGHQHAPLFLLVQPLADLLRIALVVELEEAGEDLAAGGFADGEAEALGRFVEAVA